MSNLERRTHDEAGNEYGKLIQGKPDTDSIITPSDNRTDTTERVRTAQQVFRANGMPNMAAVGDDLLKLAEQVVEKPERDSEGDLTDAEYERIMSKLEPAEHKVRDSWGGDNRLVPADVDSLEGILEEYWPAWHDEYGTPDRKFSQAKAKIEELLAEAYKKGYISGSIDQINQKEKQ